MLVLCEENPDNYDIKEWVVLHVDGEKIKADTWYTLRDGQIKEVTEE